MRTPTSYFLAINVGIGTGIAADAMLATIARARSFHSSKEAFRWAGAIGLTHWLFPMVGFLGGWFLANHGVARVLVYGGGGIILLFYVIQVLRERSRVRGDDGEEVERSSFWLAVWGVSVDALVTGPGKAAATADWTSTQVAISFPLVGVVVFVLVLLSTMPAMALHKRIVTAQLRSWRRLALFFSAATWVELLIFTWFATLSLLEASGALGLVHPSYTLTTIYATISGILLIVTMGRKVWRAQCVEARKLAQASDAA